MGLPVGRRRGRRLLIVDLGADLARRNMQFGFGFLAERAGFDIPFRLLDWTILISTPRRCSSACWTPC